MIKDRFARAVQNAPKPQRTGRVKSISRHGFHDLAYVDWGRKSSADKVLCVHGLTRNGRDFDALASLLSKSARVVCPDLVGRGKSDWFDDASDYHLLQYNMDITVLTAKVDYERFDWIGTSLGGLMGISLAGIENSPVRRLVINDVGPTIPTAALQRISNYLGKSRIFHSLDEVEANLRETLKPFGPMTDDDWTRMAAHSSRQTDDGLVMHHDPGIMQNFRHYSMFMHFSLWRYWENITCPVLILRGTNSDFLTENLLQRMLQTLPHADAIEFEDVGHTPTLNAPEQIDPILDWLERTRSFVED